MNFPPNDERTIPTQAQRHIPNVPPVPIPRPPNAPHYNDEFVPPPPSLARESAARDRLRKRKLRSRTRGGEWAWVIIAFAMLSVVIVMSMSVSLLVRANQSESIALPTNIGVLPTPVDARIDFTTPSGDPMSLIPGERVTLNDGRSIVLQPWDGNSRFTMLAMGLDRRTGETGLGFRTDTMMLVSIDPVTDSIGVLSIPRDLFVEMPGYASLQRVNSAMIFGELDQPGYGPRLAMQTVQYNLGMRVNDYLAVDFRTVITVVDAIGGVEIDVPYNIADYQMPDLNFGYDPLILQAGPQLMNGYTALRYARTRHGDSDFERARRQQQVIFAIRDRILNLNMLPQMIVNAPGMLSNLQDNIYTGLSLDQMIQLALYVKDVPPENIRTGVIDGRYIMPYITPEGASVLIPNRSMLGLLMVEVFGENYSQ
jgi:polyisoprenyl-teichoic acid--peptidoglycan teichoic acid transferase